MLTGHDLVYGMISPSLPPCLSAMRFEMDAGPVGIQLNQSVSSKLLYFELCDKEIRNSNIDSSSGIARLFRNLISAFVEIPVTSISNDDRHLFVCLFFFGYF